MFNKKDVDKKVKEKGYLDFPVSEGGEELSDAIRRMKEEKDAVILAHYYQRPEVQDLADFTGDSLALSEKAAATKAKMILFAGVHFMAETAKILSPEKKVLLPDLNAGCSMADSCPANEFERFIKKYPGSVVVTYVNTTAEVKALSDVVCTSSNAVKIVEAFPKDKRIIFAPDKNLGEYVRKSTGREIVLWDGACHVHVRFSACKIRRMKEDYPEAVVIAHPECEREVLEMADFIGSTSQLISFARKDERKTYIVATEPGVIYRMSQENPDKLFLPAPPKVPTECNCSECEFMKMITLEKIYNTLKYEQPEIVLDKEMIEKAREPIERMLEITARKQ